MEEVVFRVQEPVQHNYQKLLNIMVSCFQTDGESFSKTVVVALREYADAIDRGDNGNDSPDVFKASNGCEIQVIAGAIERKGNR